MTTYKIDSDIPLIARTGSGNSTRKYPFNQMKIGERFLINGAKPSSVANAAQAYGKKYGLKFALRSTPEGYRCWRTK